MASDDDGWIRPLAKNEVFLEIVHQHGFMVTCYALDLNSKLPLKEIQIKKALLHLLRKVPNLRLCIRPKDGKDMWFHKLESENIDFKVLGKVNFQKEYEAVTVHHYNTFVGPLWCSRLLPLPDDAPCSMPEIKSKYPHHYKFLLGFHHSITDGISSMEICNIFLHLLNDVIGSKPINDFEQLAEHVSPERTEKLQEELVAQLSKNPVEIKKYQTMLKGSIDDVLLLKAYPPPKNASAKTLNLSYSLSEEETTEFLERCKKEEVTVHSGFCSVINFALAEMLSNAGFKEQPFRIKNSHIVNNRRYWQRDARNAFGVHIGKITILSEVTSNINDFWNQARVFHKTLKSYLDDEGPLKESIATAMSIPPNADITQIIEEMNMGDSYYCSTNMGNLKTIFSGEGEHVQVTHLQRTISTSKTLASHVFQTFRGKFLYGLDYEAQIMSKETAQLYVNTIFEKLKAAVSL